MGVGVDMAPAFFNVKRVQQSNFHNNIKIHFDNINLLDLAFHHRSYANENGNHLLNNERLEFLGDSVLGMVVATYLYDSMRSHPEGDLAKIKSIVVSRIFHKKAPVSFIVTMPNKIYFYYISNFWKKQREEEI